jgi:3-phosphoglycerate kinase
MGVFEWANFAEGTRALGEAVAEATTKGATTIIGACSLHPYRARKRAE